MHEGVSSILESLRKSDLEGAKRKLETLSLEVRSDRERGSLLAVSGICFSLIKGKGGNIHSWSEDRIARAARAIESSQMADDLDRGYAETLLEYAKTKQKQQ